MGSGQSFGYPIQRLDSVSRGDGTAGGCTEKCGGEHERISSRHPLAIPATAWRRDTAPRKCTAQLAAVS